MVGATACRRKQACCSRRKARHPSRCLPRLPLLATPPAACHASRSTCPSPAAHHPPPGAGADLAIHRFFIFNEHPTSSEVYRVWLAVQRMATWPAAGQPARAGQVACSVTELQDATAIGPRGGRKVGATSKCVRVLDAWGLVQRQQAYTAVTLFGGREHHPASHMQADILTR